MAKITTINLKGFLSDIKKTFDDFDEIALEMLTEGAKVAGDEWENGIREEVHKIRSSDGKEYVSKRGYIDTGDMLDSVEGDIVDNRRAQIYPRGYDSKGVPNAEKAFVLNYGTSSYKGSRFVDEINKRVEIEAPVAMGKVMDDALKKHGL